jgi:hypothetical protein
MAQPSWGILRGFVGRALAGAFEHYSAKSTLIRLFGTVAQQSNEAPIRAAFCFAPTRHG